MNHMHQEVRIDAPVEHVWAFYCDTPHWQDWMPRAKCSDFSGPVDKAGTTYVATMRLMGFEMKTTYKIVEVEPLRLIHEHTDAGPQDNFLRFEPDGDATRLVLDSDWEMPGKHARFHPEPDDQELDRAQRAPDARRFQGARRDEGPRPGLKRSHPPRLTGGPSPRPTPAMGALVASQGDCDPGQPSVGWPGSR